MAYKAILFEQRDGVAEITLNRPDSVNAMNMEMMQELSDAAIRCDEDAAIRCVIITGKGKIFSAGGDIGAFASEGDNLPAAMKAMTIPFHAAVSRFVRMDAPVIAAVNGMCAGGGLSLAASADLVLAADNAGFAMAYTAAALSPDGSSTYFLPRRIGDRRTRELMLTNRRLSAEEALDWGLINMIVPADRLLEEARALAGRLATGPTVAFGRVKTLLNASFENGLETQMELEARAISDMTRTDDTKEGMNAFLNKRKPQFNGR